MLPPCACSNRIHMVSIQQCTRLLSICYTYKCSYSIWCAHITLPATCYFTSSSNKAIEYLESKIIYCLLFYYRDKHSLRLITESRLTRDIKHNHLVSYLTLYIPAIFWLWPSRISYINEQDCYSRWQLSNLECGSCYQEY